MHNQMQPMRTQGNGMISHFVHTCHFYGMIGHLKPNCFNYIKKCRLESLKEERLKNRASLHKLRKPRNMFMTTKNEIVEPRWVRKNEHACHCANVTPIDATRSNGLGRSIGTLASH